MKYTSAGDNVPTVLSTAVQGGNPPDLASISQPGLVKQFAQRKAIKPIDFAKAAMAKNYTPSWITLGTVLGPPLRHGLQGRQQVHGLVLGAGLQERRREAAEDVDAAAGGRQDAARLGHAGVLDRRRRRLA